MSKKDTPLYTAGIEYAKQHGELTLYRESHERNIACEQAIEKASAENYKDNHFDSAAVIDTVLTEFSAERIAYVLANTICFKGYDGRISAANKNWAKTIYIVSNPHTWGGDHNCYFIVNIHSGLLDLLAAYFRSHYQDDYKSLLR